MDLPVPAPAQCVVGLTIPLPEPWAAQVRIVRAEAGEVAALREALEASGLL